MPKNGWIFVTDRESWIECAKEGSYGLKRALIKDAAPGDPLAAYVQRELVFAGLGQINSPYYFDKEFADYPHRVDIKMVLDFDNAVDIRTLIDKLDSFTDKAHWPVRFKGGALKIPISDYEIVKGAIERKALEKKTGSKVKSETEIREDLGEKIRSLSELTAPTLHDKIAEMLHIVGLRKGYDSNLRYKTRPDSPYQIDVAWLQNKNSQVAIEIHHGGILGDALDRLRHAKDFNFRKVILVIVEPEDHKRALNILKFDEKLKHVIDLWSVKSIYEMYSACEAFHGLYSKFDQSSYKEEMETKLY